MRTMSTQFRPITSRQEWLDWRSRYLGASEVGAVAGVDPYRRPLSVFAEKAKLIGGLSDNSQLRRGRWLEHAAFAALKEQNPDQPWLQPNVFAFDDDLGLSCTPDCLTEDEGGALVNCQIKCSSPRIFDEWDDEPPLAYVLQTLTEGMLLDSASNMLVVFVVDGWSARLEYFDIPRDERIEAAIKVLAERFWADLMAGNLPKPDYGLDRDLIHILHRPSEPGPIDLSTDNRIYELLDERERLDAILAQAKDACERNKTEIIAKLDGAERAIVDGWRISNKLVRAKAYHVAAREYPRLTITRMKD